MRRPSSETGPPLPSAHVQRIRVRGICCPSGRKNLFVTGHLPTVRTGGAPCMRKTSQSCSTARSWTTRTDWSPSVVSARKCGELKRGTQRERETSFHKGEDMNRIRTGTLSITTQTCTLAVSCHLSLSISGSDRSDVDAKRGKLQVTQERQRLACVMVRHINTCRCGILAGVACDGWRSII